MVGGVLCVWFHRQTFYIFFLATITCRPLRCAPATEGGPIHDSSTHDPSIHGSSIHDSSPLDSAAFPIKAFKLAGRAGAPKFVSVHGASSTFYFRALSLFFLFSSFFPLFSFPLPNPVVTDGVVLQFRSCSWRLWGLVAGTAFRPTPPTPPTPPTHQKANQPHLPTGTHHPSVFLFPPPTLARSAGQQDHQADHKLAPAAGTASLPRLPRVVVTSALARPDAG